MLGNVLTAYSHVNNEFPDLIDALAAVADNSKGFGHYPVGRGGWVLPYMGYIGMCGPKGYGFSAVLVINRVSILAILVLNRVWRLCSSLELGMLFRRCYFSSLPIRPSTKALQKICL